MIYLANQFYTSLVLTMAYFAAADPLNAIQNQWLQLGAVGSLLAILFFFSSKSFSDSRTREKDAKTDLKATIERYEEKLKEERAHHERELNAAHQRYSELNNELISILNNHILKGGAK